eukprot:XP_017951888.1 PREDICTED: tenascin-X [Xenopus tropicalis]
MPSFLPLLFFILFFKGCLAPPSTSTQCPDAGGVRALLKRLEILEKLVRDIKGQCSPPCCGNVQSGADDPASHKSPSCPQPAESCSGGCGGEEHGICIDGQCQCKDGYMGENCQLKTCPEDCNDQGRCKDGQCFCFSGYFGVDCSSKSCPNNCQNHGRCDKGVCICDPGFTGVDCSSRTCPKNCFNRGRCEDGVCICYPDYTGPDCSIKTCLNDCQDHGRCEDGMCVCDPGFTGIDCSSRTCHNDCQNHGRCENGLCVCDSGYSGPDCGIMSCPEDCNEQGRCVSGVCVCDSGFIGPDCGTRVCSPECERRGRCEDGECICNPGFTGPDCEIKTCPNDCHKQGMCVDGKCVCDSGYTGVDCQVKTCPNKCHNRGRCEDGICICNSGYSGSDCGSKSCPKNCSGNGQCVKGKCVCDSGFIGPVCGTRACPAGCGNHGRCLRGTCVCSPGYTGVDCASRLCPKNCHNRGRCEQGVCICNPEYIGLDCGSRTCPKNCHGKGQCDDGVCICDLGYTGLDCATKSCFNDCHHRGRCEDGVCICDVGYTGLDCGTLSCPKDCHNRGKCENGVCVCDPGFTGLDCGSRSCPNNCNYHGRCEDGECICDSGYTDHDCGSKMCSNNCQNHGICDNGKCICDSGYAGVDCGLRTCQNDCNNRGQCIDGVCICNSGYTDLDCGFRTCPFECHNRGQCVNGICICDSGYSGLDCGSASCPNNCQNRGKCHNGECVCDFGYTGVECGTEACPENCHIHGRCEQGVCICQPGYTGLDCRSKSCPKNCSGNGQCINGKCICDFGYTGPVCGSRACPGNCGGRGKCINGVCVCKKGYEGADCSVVVTELVAVTGLHVTSVEESSVTIEWDLQQTPPDVYAISFKAKKENGLLNNTVDGTLTSFVQTGLASGEEYLVSIQPQKGLTVGPETTVTATTSIEAPLGLRVTEITTTSFLLRWERPQSFPDRYIVTLVSPTGKERKLKVPGKGDRVRITALEEGTIYKVILRAERGQEQSKGMETTAKTALDRERKNIDDEDARKKKGKVVTPQQGGQLEKPRFSEDHYRPATTGQVLIHSGGGEGSSKTREITEYIVEDQTQKGVVNTTRKTIQTTIITTYHIQNHKEGDVVDMFEDTKSSEYSQTKHLPDRKKISSDVEGSDVGETTGQTDITGTIIRKHTPEKKVQSWIARGKIIDASSVEKPPNHLTQKTNKTSVQLGDTQAAGQQRKKPSDKSVEVVTGIQVNLGSTESKTFSDEKLPLTINEKQLENLKDERDPGSILDDVSTKVHTEGRNSRKNNTGLEKKRLDAGVRVQKQNKMEKLYPGGLHIKAVIENLPTKLSVYNGTFIQRLESYLRSTSYPLRANQTVESVARAIFLYLVKYKPNSFTGMVYDRLPQKTPDSPENEEPFGASKIQGNMGSVMVDNKPDQAKEVVVLRPKDRHATMEGSQRKVDTPAISRYTSSSELYEVNMKVLKETPTSREEEKLISEKSTLQRLPLKTQLNKTYSEKISDSTKRTIVPDNQRVWQAGEKDKTFTGKNKNESLKKTTVSPTTMEYLIYTPSVDTLNRPTQSSEDKTAPGVILLTNDKGITPKKQPYYGKKVPPRPEKVGSKIKEGEIKNERLIDKDSRSKILDDKASLLQAREGEEKENEEKTIQALGSAGPSTHPTSVKISGPGIFGRPTVVKSTPTNLVVSLDGLGVLLDKVMIHYRPFQAIMTDMPQQLEVGKGVGKVVIRDLEPGTTYRLEIHGLLRGQSSKSYILVADTAQSPTILPTEVTTKPTISPIEDILTTTASSATTRPRIPVQMGALQVRNVTSESITLVWKAKIGAYDSFLVRYDEVTDGVSPQELSVPGDQREVTLRGLTQDTRYEVLLYGIREGKLTRPFKEEVTTEPHPKRGTPPRLSPLLVSEVHRNSALLSWEPLDGDFDAYILRYGSPEGPMQEETLRGDQTSFLISGLVAAVNYSVELRGIWGESYTEPQATYVLTEKPQPPRLESLTLFDVRSESLNLSWDVQGGDFDSFLLWYRDGEGKPQEIALDKDLRSSTVRDLKPGKKYKFVLYGISGEKRSKPVTAEGSTDKLQPPQLESLSVSDVHSDSVLLSWVVQGGKFDSFLLNYRDAEGKPKEASLEGEQRSVPVGDLKPGKKYKFVLYGISGGKKSKAAIAETTTKPREKVVPSSPATPTIPRLVDLQANEIGKDSVNLSWRVEGESSFDWIVVQYGGPDGVVREQQVPGGDTSTLVTGLLPSRRYKFSLYGIKGQKHSKPLSTEIETGFLEAVGQPSSFLNYLFVSPRGPHSILVSWQAPEGSFDSFVIRYGIEGHEKPQKEASVNGTARTLLLANLQPDTPYKVKLHGVRRGKEQGSLETTGRTGSLDLEPPQNLRFNDVEETSLTVSWDPPNPETTTFKVSYQLAKGGEPESVNVVGDSKSLQRLNVGTRYEVTVVSVRGFEESQPLTGYITTGGGGPHSLHAHDVTEESALLRWEPEPGFVDRYVVTYRAENVLSVTHEVPGDQTELPISGLNPHTEYYASVQSLHGSKLSSPTSTSFITSADTPRELLASQITAQSALLTWKPPQVVPDGYRLVYQTHDGEIKELILLANLSSFTLSHLTPSTPYKVQLHALRGASSSAPISTSFTTGRIRYPFPRDCWEKHMNGDLQSGVFTIYLGGSKDDPLLVYCDMETDGGGWIVFQRRIDGRTDFWRNWRQYKEGFGNLTSEFWLGNIALHRLSSLAPYELRVDLRAGAEAAYAVYEDFRVEGEDKHFRLRIGAYRGNAGDSLSYHNNMIFSTRDRDAEKRILPCSISYRGAWWYKNCHYANLNGMYGNNKDHQGVNWHTWKGFEFSIPFTEMKMRPQRTGNWRRL